MNLLRRTACVMASLLAWTLLVTVFSGSSGPQMLAEYVFDRVREWR